MPLKKSLGQHFLMHARIAERIAHVAEIAPTDTVLEIGPGGGILTRALLAHAKKIIAVETDRELFEKLRSTFASEIAEGKLDLVLGDIRTFDPTNIGGAYSIVANIPYYLTGEIMRMFLEAAHQPQRMTLLVQKEVAERIARSRKESLLSLSVKVYGTPKIEFTVPHGAFRPAPGVDSAVLSIRNITRRCFATTLEETRFFTLIRAGFAHKRKLLASNLAGLALPDALEHADIAPKARAEDLALSAWLALAQGSPR
ncbi:MAG: 16S rRNA (adenine(1518)-N(6)/adenine(1519)-N(6))-dimethyltransferase RsmA [Minisyncoccia bacterium]